MNRRKLIETGALLLVGGAVTSRADAAPVGATKLVRTGDKWQLMRDGKPYFVKGVGGNDKLPLLKSLGANGIRTWGADSAKRDLDAAHAHGLTVTVGIWLGHAEHGFKYSDVTMVREQFENARKVIALHKNHPALLAWGIGNEMEGDGSDPLVWQAVQEIAAMAHREDPHHPTVTVIAEIGNDASKAKAIQTWCPDIDIIGVNSYGGLATLAERWRAAGITKPYLVTEFGPNGTWEVGKTAWNAPLEPTSTDKARAYLNSYLRSVASQNACVGSYAFLWGDKMEGTPTWYGLLLPEGGERLGATDVLSYLWTGKWTLKPAPDILAWQSSIAEKQVAPGTRQTALCIARGTGLVYNYVVRPENNETPQPEPGQKPLAPTHVVASPDGTLTFTAPTAPGAYRLFVTVRDPATGTGATANTPFLVKN